MGIKLSRRDENRKNVKEWQVLLAALLTVILVYYVDYSSHESLRFYVFYFPTLMVVSWYLNLKKAIFFLGVSLALWFHGYIKFESSPLWAIVIWNTGVTFATFSFVIAMTYILKQKQIAIEWLSRKDPLTGVWNRTVLEEKLSEERARSKRYGHSLALIYFDLNHFKGVNDQFGHAAGDAVLKDTTVFSQSVLRETDFLIRAGGDEFCVILPETDSRGADAFGRRLAAILRTQLPYGLSASVGIAVFPVMPESVAEIIEMADQAMYGAKTKGIDCFLKIYEKTVVSKPRPPVSVE